MKIFAVNRIYTQTKTSPSANNSKYGRTYFRGRDLLDLPEREVFNKISSSLTAENFLGQGTEAEVYRIKDTNYCVRIPYEMLNIRDFEYSREITPIDKVNHIVAKLGLGRSIRKFFEGVTPKKYMNSIQERLKLQENISEMPVKSYTELLHQISNAVDNEMMFDYSGGNLIVNEKKQKLTAIDFYPISENPRAIRPLTEMYSVLTNNCSSEKIGKKIFDKIVDAGLEEFKPYKIPCMDLALFDFVELCLKRMSSAYTPNCEKQKSIIMYNCDVLKNLKKREIVDKSAFKPLEEQLRNLKTILRNVH